MVDEVFYVDRVWNEIYIYVRVMISSVEKWDLLDIVICYML